MGTENSLAHTKWECKYHIGSMTFDIVSMEASNGAKASIGTTENAPKAEVGFANNVLVTDSYTIEITDYRVIPAGEAGNEYAPFWATSFYFACLPKGEHII